MTPAALLDTFPYVLLAIDGGNSKTDAVLLDATGAFVAARTGRGSGGGPGHLAEVVAELLDGLAVEPSRITHCVAAVAGLDFPEDGPAFRAALERTLSRAAVEVVNDALAVLDAGGGTGLAVIYGAGFNTVARGPLGLAAHPALGWPTGEWGGGHDLGREAVRLACRSADGRGPRSRLERDVLAATGQKDHASLARAIRDGVVTSSAVGRLTPLLLDAADAGDPAALPVVERAVDEVAELSLLVGTRAFGASIPAGTPAVLAGGVFRHRGWTGRIRAALAGLGFAAGRASADPVVGVVREVAALAGVRATGVPSPRLPAPVGAAIAEKEAR